MSLKQDNGTGQRGTELPKAFFAYPSKPDIAETMRNAVEKINDCGVVMAKTWEGCKIGGKIIITEICNEIDRADLFCADMSGLNHNVMFELGFAIARNKRVWLAVDPSVIETKSDWNKLRILTTVGISNYCNSNEIRDKFLTDQPWLDTQNTIFKQTIEPSLYESKSDSLFYLKSRHSTEASTVISTEIAKSVTALGLRLIVDDPRETNVQPLAWYGEQVYSSRAVIVHLINQGREGAHLHNAKYSFVAGLASGMNKDLLMLAQGDSLAPLDYRDLLKQYQTASEAANHLRGWLVPVIEKVKQESNERQLYLSSIKLAQQLGQLKIGEPIAENEANSLIEEYFVETTSYLEARDGRQSIFVGRKGAGKSANFLKLADALQADKRNIVCVVKPLSYEMQGIIELLKKLPGTSLKGYAIESLWKFLIYSELALVTETKIHARPSGQIHEAEKNLIAILDKDSDLFRADFAVRLERCVKRLLNVSANSYAEGIGSGRSAIAEVLHDGWLRMLRTELCSALDGKQRIAILVDNLDKAWDKQGDIDSLSDFLFGLLRATNGMSGDFRDVGRERVTLKISLAVFIRSDIFYHVMANAREPDKIPYTKLSWADDELLLRVIDERFTASLQIPATEVWNRYFCAYVRGIPVRDYFVRRILKRPRDLVFFVKAAITTAINRRHGSVDESDILQAEKQYSQFAIDSVLVENGITVRELERIIYEFVGSKAIIDRSQICSILGQSIDGNISNESIIEHLCKLTFLGVEVKPEEFRFADDPGEGVKNGVLAGRLASSRSQAARYKINPAFWGFLEIGDTLAP